jgi:hypothetical protein
MDISVKDDIITIDDYNTWTDLEKERFITTQLENFAYLAQNLIEYFSIDSPDYWKAVADRMQEVLASCDEIDYQEQETADAYAIWHLLDRYHRFQLMQLELLNHNYTNHLKNRPIDIIDIGTGPAPALFAFSDYYQTLNSLVGKSVYTCKEDYIEQSWGFRSFLHHFCEISCNTHLYDVPFHHGSFESFKDVTFEQERNDMWYERYTEKFRFDIAIFSNFFTTTSKADEFRADIINVCRVMRNHGLIIIVGACNDRYPDIYDVCDKIIARRFRNWKFYGWWKKLFHCRFTYNYADEYGEKMREFYSFIKKQFTTSDTWQYIAKRARDFLDERIENTLERIQKDAWEGVSWQMIVYQKRVWPTERAKRRNSYKTHI